MADSCKAFYDCSAKRAAYQLISKSNVLPGTFSPGGAGVNYMALVRGKRDKFRDWSLITERGGGGRKNGRGWGM